MCFLISLEKRQREISRAHYISQSLETTFFVGQFPTALDMKSSWYIVWILYRWYDVCRDDYSMFQSMSHDINSRFCCGWFCRGYIMIRVMVSDSLDLLRGNWGNHMIFQCPWSNHKRRGCNCTKPCGYGVLIFGLINLLCCSCLCSVWICSMWRTCHVIDDVCYELFFLCYLLICIFHYRDCSFTKNVVFIFSREISGDDYASQRPRIIARRQSLRQLSQCIQTPGQRLTAVMLCGY